MWTVPIVLLLAGPAEVPTSTLAPPRPFEVELSDPLVAPVARASQEIATWDQAEAMLRRQSTELRSAEAGLQRAEGSWRQSLSVLLPNAGVALVAAYDLLNPDIAVLTGGGAAVAASDRTPTSPVATAAISVEQSVVDLSAWRGLGAAAAGERSARAHLFDVQRRVTQGLAQSLIAVVAAERAAEINRVGLRQALERVALTGRTFELGAATKLDVVRVRQDVAVARTAVILGDEQLRRTREALGELLGVPGEVGVTHAFALEGLVEETRKHCQPLGPSETRSDLVSAQAQLDAAEEGRKQASAGYLPRLGVNSSVFALTTDPGPGRFATWSISAILSFPLWEGGLREGQVEEREGFREQVAQATEALRRSIEVEVARSRRAEEVAKMLVDAATDARDLAARTDALTRRSFEMGRASSLELVQTAAVLRQAELNLALREFEWVQARLDAFLTEARCEG